jgi:hypothetical protein
VLRIFDSPIAVELLPITPTRPCQGVPGIRIWVLMMRTSFILRVLLCLIVAVALLSRFVVGIHAVAQGVATLPANEPYSLSYAAGGNDARGNFLGGTELMNLVAFEGKLYAGIGYWMDRPQLFPARADPRGGSWMGRPYSSPEQGDPQSGAQILVLDSKLAQWRQEYAFNQKDISGEFRYHRLSAMEVIRFHRFDAAGNVVGTSVAMLAVGFDGESGGVYTRRSAGDWQDTRVPTFTPIRSLAVHYDSTDRVEKLFAAPGGSLDRNLDRAMYSGVYDPSAPGGIRWNPTPERIALQSRVMSMTECGGALFAAAKPSIFRRNDAQKTWDVVYSFPITNAFDESRYASGFRALTCINGPDGKKTLLSGFEGSSGDILRIDPQTGTATIELDTRQFLTQQWGAPPVKPDTIAGYNDIPAVQTAAGEVRLIGLLSRSPNPTEMNAAWFLSRMTGNPPRYALHEVNPPANWPHTRSDAALWSVRAIAVSPFPEDQNQILYMGGYDGHFQPDHNTAWLYRVGVDTALAPYRGMSR